jgi:hypothetical protein
MSVTADGAPAAQDFTLKSGDASIYDALIVTVSSSDQGVLPNDHLAVDPDCGKSAAHYECQLTVTPAGQGGTVTVKLTATDLLGRMVSASFLLEIDTRPLAVDYSLTAFAGLAFSGTLPASDADGDAMVFSIDTPPAHGVAVVTDAATGAFTYTPAADYSGSDSFTFVANDGFASSAAATVSLVVKALPVDDDPPAHDNPPPGDDHPPPADDVPPTGDGDPPPADDSPPTSDGDPPAGQGAPRNGGGGAFGPLGLCLLGGLAFRRRATRARRRPAPLIH